MRCQMRSTSWLTGCGSETFCDIAAGRWPSQCQASYLWFMAPQWSCIFQSLCRVSKAGLFNRPPGWPGDDANDDPCQVQQVSAGGRRGQGWKVANLVFLTWWRFIRFFFLWPKRHQWWFHECFERQNHESFENESNSVMTHEPLRELTYWLQESALSLHPVSKFLSLQEEEDLQAPRRTGSGLDNVSVGQQNPQMNRYEDGPKSLGDRSQRFC